MLFQSLYLLAEVLTAEALIAEVLVSELLISEVLMTEVLVTEVLITEGGGFEPPPTDSESAVLPLNYPSNMRKLSLNRCSRL